MPGMKDAGTLEQSNSCWDEKELFVIFDKREVCSLDHGI